MSNRNIAVIGDENSVLGFKSLGIDVFSPSEPLEVRKTIEQLARDEYGVIFITEQLAIDVQDTIAQYDDAYIPAIIPIPSNQGTLNIGMDRIDENVEKAVGINLF